MKASPKEIRRIFLPPDMKSNNGINHFDFYPDEQYDIEEKKDGKVWLIVPSFRIISAMFDEKEVQLFPTD